MALRERCRSALIEMPAVDRKEVEFFFNLAAARARVDFSTLGSR
jgi:hypothetical protein